MNAKLEEKFFIIMFLCFIGLVGTTIYSYENTEVVEMEKNIGDNHGKQNI